jgi:phosphate transport system protein
VWKKKVKDMNDFSWLQQAITRMGHKTVAGVEAAIRAMLTNDMGAAAQTRDIEKKVDAMYFAINEYCLEHMAGVTLQRNEINFVVNSLKIAMELERICDYANQIAKLVQRKFSQQDVDVLKCLSQPAADMRDQSLQMLRKALESYVEQNPGLTKSIMEQDASVDKRNKDLFRTMLCIASVQPWGQEVIMDYHIAIRYIERVADRATNIAELVYYIAHGEPMKKITIREDLWDD